MTGDEMLGRYRLIYDSTYIWPDGRGGYDYSRKFISEVELDEEGRSVLSRPATPILAKEDNITINAYTRLASGEILYADTTDMITRILPHDRRWVFVNFRRAEPGAILHLEWLVISKEANIAGKRFLGRTVPVESVLVIISVPETWVFNFALSSGAQAETERRSTASRSGPPLVNYLWISKNIPALSKEDLSPPVERMIPCLYFSFSYDKGWKGQDLNVVDWRYIAALYYQQLRSFMRIGSNLNPIIDSLGSEASDERELAFMAYRWLGDHFRPLETEILLSNNVNDALERGRGTQAEAAAILLALFELLEIPSTAFLVATTDVGEPLKQVPALFWFDRLLLACYADNDTIWIDPYYQLMQIGIIPFEDQGARALSLAGAGGDFVVVPVADFRANGKAIHMKLHFDASGSLHGEATEIYSGAMIPEISTFMKGLEKSERKMPWERRLASSFPSARIQEFILVPPDSSGQAYKVGYSFTTGPIVRPFADRAYIPMDLLGNWADLPSLPNRARQFPIELRRPRFELERITLNISPPFEVEYLPGNYSENLDIGEVYSVARGDKQSVTITRGFGLKKSTLPFSEYGSLRNFINRARTEADKHIILKRTN